MIKHLKIGMLAMVLAGFVAVGCAEEGNGGILDGEGGDAVTTPASPATTPDAAMPETTPDGAVPSPADEDGEGDNGNGDDGLTLPGAGDDALVEDIRAEASASMDGMDPESITGANREDGMVVVETDWEATQPVAEADQLCEAVAGMDLQGEEDDDPVTSVSIEDMDGNELTSCTVTSA